MSKISKKLIPINPSQSKFVPWSKTIFKSPIKLDKDAGAGVVLDEQNVPQLFVFDTPAFLDVLSVIDDAIADKLSHQDYHSKSVNPAGWLIDEIETKLPPETELVQSLKKSIHEANNKGWVPFSKVQAETGLS